MADTTDAGDLIAPLNTVLERLEGKITIEDAEALVASFADERTRQVKPGDLITARFFNQMIVDLKELRRRVALLEGSTRAPTLVRIDPSGPVRVGMLITLIGTGFDPLTTTTPIAVELGEVTVREFVLGSGPGVLKLVVPDSFTGLPRTISARVRVGSLTSNALPVTIQQRPRPDQGGKALIALKESTTVPPGNIQEDSQLTYVWTVQAQTVLPDDYKFQLEITNTRGAEESAWRRTLEITPPSTRIARDGSQEVRVALKVPESATFARIALKVVTDPAIRLEGPGPIDITVNAPPDTPDQRAEVMFDTGSSTFDLVADVVFDGQTMKGIKVPRGQETQFVLLVEPKETPAGSGAGAYAFEAEFEGSPADWTVQTSPTTSENLAVGRSEQVTAIIKISERAGAGTVRMLRVWARHRESPRGRVDFSSFHRFPVQALG
jgi:hypothetical protein